MGRNSRNTLLALLGLLLLVSLTTAAAPIDTLLPPSRPVAEAIDYYIDQKLKAVSILPAPQADDPTLARRLHLDLSGRIPTATEARTYSSSTEPNKRVKLIDSLLASAEFARHNANEFDEFLRNDTAEVPDLRGYLRVAFQEKRSWDRMFRELLGVTPSPEPTRPEQFVLKRLKDPDGLTRDVSSIFFGLNISCAQCHRHPHIKSLTQDYFYGMKAFFANSYDFQGNLVDRQYTRPVQFKKGMEVQDAQLLFLNGNAVAAPPLGATDLNKAIQEESQRIQDLQKNYAKTKTLPPAPAFSPRAELVKLALAADNRELFARAMVNRLWYRFLGHGLVMRVDQMHARNEASHPELLRWLARDFIAHDYDLVRLIRGIVSSKVYARTSRWDGPEAPAPALFAVAGIRPLTPWQFGLSHRLASDPTLLVPGQLPAIRDKQIETLEAQVQKVFGKLIEQPRDGMQIGITEALKLSNDDALLKLTGDQLVPLLSKLPDRQKQIEQALWVVLSRPPTEEEYVLLGTYLQKRDGRPEALRQMVWILFNSPEFRFNH